MIFRILLVFALSLMAGGVRANESESRTLDIGGVEREYHIYRPANLSRQTPAPLVLMMHGGYGSDAQAEKSYGWDKEADAEGFVVAYPNGIRRSWNAGGLCCGTAAKNKVDDVGFITQLISTLIKSDNIDPKRVYLTGMSNGAAMSYRYACEGAYPVAAIGVVAGSFSAPCAEKPHAISVMEIHGMDDQHIPMKGGVGAHATVEVPWIPVQQTIDTFLKAADCPAPTISDKGVLHTSASLCPMDREVTLITIDNAGHQWPGEPRHSRLATMILPLDQPSDAMNATSTLWAFFKRHASQ